MESRRLVLTVINFLVAITLLPLGIEVFARAGEILVGARALALHPWLSTVFAYVPVLVLLFIYLKATLDPLEKYGFSWSSQLLGFSVVAGLVSAAALYGVDVWSGTLADFKVLAHPGLVAVVGYVLAWGVLAPLVEEVLFRGLIQTVFLEKLSSSWTVHPAVFVAAGFEVLLHVSVPFYASGDPLFVVLGRVWPQLAYVFVFGSVGGWVYQRTRSLTGPFVIHALGNAGELVLFWLLA